MSSSFIKPTFTNAMEIRMGSPFRCADLSLDGPWTPVLPECNWQDVFSHSRDQRFLGLVAWDIQKNKPGFRIVLIDSIKQIVRQSDRLEGCCQGIVIDDGGLVLKINDVTLKRSFEDERFQPMRRITNG